MKLISLKEIASRLKQNPILQDVGWEFVVTHAADFLELIGIEQVT